MVLLVDLTVEESDEKEKLNRKASMRSSGVSKPGSRKCSKCGNVKLLPLAT